MANFANLARGMSRAPETPANTPTQLQTSKYEGDREATGDIVEMPGDARVHRVQLTGLQPDTEYSYRAHTGSLSTEVATFVSAPPRDGEHGVRLVAMSDMQIDRGNPTKFGEIVNEGIIPWVTDRFGEPLHTALGMVVVPGDLVDNGTVHDQWRDDFFGPAATLFAAVPVYPVYGNHEADTEFFRQLAYHRVRARGGVIGAARGGCRRSGRGGGRFAAAETGNERIDVGVADVGTGDDPQQRANRAGVAFLGEYAAQHAVDGGFPHVDDFVRFHVEQLVTFGHDIPNALVPGVECALYHFDSPLRDGDRIDITHDIVPRIAAMIFSTEGR